MNDLTALLDRAAGSADTTGATGGVPLDVRPDLARGRQALARTRVRRGAAGLAGVAAVGVLGVALTRGGDEPTRAADEPTAAADPSPTAGPTPTPTPTSTPTVDPSAPVTGSTAPNFFDVPAPPTGWEIQGSSPSSVTFARAGDTTVPEDFRGKIVLTLTGNPPTGKERSVDGRTFWVAADTGGGFARITVLTGPGEPQGHLELQYDVSDGWTAEQAIAFLATVTVLEGADAIRG